MKYHVTKDFTILSEMHYMCYQVFEQPLRLSVTMTNYRTTFFLFLYISLLTHPTFPYLQLHVWIDTCSWYDILALNFIEVKNLRLTLHIQSYVWLVFSHMFDSWPWPLTLSLPFSTSFCSALLIPSSNRSTRRTVSPDRVLNFFLQT